jgi:hypothetical protein
MRLAGMTGLSVFGPKHLLTSMKLSLPAFQTKAIVKLSLTFVKIFRDGYVARISAILTAARSAP